jgi:hypothetical protein
MEWQGATAPGSGTAGAKEPIIDLPNGMTQKSKRLLSVSSKLTG